MSRTLEAVKHLAAAGNVRISEHGYDELAEDNIAVPCVISGLAAAVVVEDFTRFPKGPVVLQYDPERALQPSGVGDSV